MELKIESNEIQYAVIGVCCLTDGPEFKMRNIDNKHDFTASIHHFYNCTKYNKHTCRELWDIFNEQDSEALTAWKLTYGT